jgi:hypothetical protein
LQQALDQEHDLVDDLEEEDDDNDYGEVNNSKEALEQEHGSSSLAYLIDIANDMASHAERAQMAAEGNEGGMEEEEPESAESAEEKALEAEKIAEESQKLEIECVVIEKQLKNMHE